ncbi:MAG: hypothetical protein ABI600_14920 [Luteolibacter sp.]
MLKYDICRIFHDPIDSSDLSPEYFDFNRSEYAYWKQARKDWRV